jgi:bifunctional ADP-heptose synthase (sugar kinase/adenylyltransferase)
MGIIFAMLESYFQYAKQRLKVLLVGDPIYDIYEYVNVLGKASKENALAASLTGKHDVFDGGVLAAQKILENFCFEVTVFTGNIMTTKRRFVDEVYLRKLFEVQETWSEPINSRTAMLPKNISEFDLVVVTDFGHGCVTPELVHILTTEAKYLAINVQTNVANYGYNLFTKYPRADYIVIDEPEARLAMHDRTSDMTNLRRAIADRGYPFFIVTYGRFGSYGYDHGVFTHAPALTQTIVDTMGAGDAFFAVTAPLARAGMAMNDLVRVGNAAGAAKVGIRGHSRTLTLDDICLPGYVLRES